MRKAILFIGFLFISMSLSNLAKADFAKGLEAYDQGDYETALKEWLIDANQGHADAQYSLGVMYYNGYGVPENDIFAYMWWSLAAGNGGEGISIYKDSVAERMTKEEIKEAQRLSAEWLEKHR